MRIAAAGVLLLAGALGACESGNSSSQGAWRVPSAFGTDAAIGGDTNMDSGSVDSGGAATGGTIDANDAYRPGYYRTPSATSNPTRTPTSSKSPYDSTR